MNVVGQIEIAGKPYAIVDSVGGYINGILSKYILTPLSCVEGRKYDNMVEVIYEEVQSDATEQPVAGE